MNCPMSDKELILLIVHRHAWHLDDAQDTQKPHTKQHCHSLELLVAR